MSIAFILGLYHKGKFCFDRKTLHCNFKGGSTSTTTYKPSAEEKRLMNLEADYAESIMPNAQKLNTTAADLLWDSMGSTQVDYDKLNKSAQQQIGKATSGMNSLINKNNAATEDVNSTLGTYAPQYANAANTANNALGSYAPQYAAAANTANQQLASLANGVLPTAYQQNMENSIKSAMENTMGKTINNLGSRGILNSSVTGSAMNDISKNAADAVAQQYQQNISQVGNLAQQQLGNTNAALEAQKGISQQQLGNTTDALAAQIGLAQQQYGNTMGANEMNSGLYGNLLNSSGTAISTAAAAQEAAQQPALNLWQASVGLSPSGSGALNAVSGKGTTTTTQNQSSSGFWGGLAGGLIGLFCFIGSTKVDTPHGKVKIRDIKKGDKVISFNPVTGEDEITEVLKVSEPVLEKVFAIQTVDVDGNTHHVVTTKSQPLMRPDGSYVTLKNIVIGQTELKGTGIVKVIAYNGKQPVYDLCVTGSGNYHNYYANDFIAQDGSELWGKE